MFLFCKFRLYSFCIQSFHCIVKMSNIAKLQNNSEVSLLQNYSYQIISKYFLEMYLLYIYWLTAILLFAYSLKTHIIIKTRCITYIIVANLIF